MMYLWHLFVFAWWPYAWVGNITAGIIIAAIASVLWPPTRRRIDAWVKRHLTAHTAELKEAHDRTQELLHHIIKHHPDIPELPKE